MTKTWKQVTPLLLVVLALGLVSVAVVKTTGQETAEVKDKVASEQWEYLAVAGPGRSNFTPTGNSRMRKNQTFRLDARHSC